MSAPERTRAAELLAPIVEPPGFTGAAPGGPSRWRRGERCRMVSRFNPKIVVEVAFDHVTGHRFRHATRLLRWRPDKAPRQCTMEQLLESYGIVRVAASSTVTDVPGVDDDRFVRARSVDVSTKRRRMDSR